eukprot:jgi/Phyca11/20261/fgenesh1_pg.PHYCAscaffold_60_\
MSVRRGSRLRRKPTPIYYVEDTRNGEEEEFAGTEEQDMLVANEHDRATTEVEGTGGDNGHDNDGDALFDALKSGKASLENLVGEWRNRFEENDEKATREVLDLVLQACGGSGQCVPESQPLDQLDMSDLVDHVVDDLENGNGEYPIMSRGRALNFDRFVTQQLLLC